VVFLFYPQRLLDACRIRLQLERYDPAVSLNITLFASEHGWLGRPLATSGPYSDAISGVAIAQMALGAGKYLLVPSTYSPSVQASFRIVVHSSTSTTTITRR
jgi:calpain-7